MRDLDGVVEHVLAVARAVLHPAQELDDLRVQTVDVRLEGRALALRLYRGVDLALGLGDHLLDARRVDAAVLNELLKRNPRDLTPHGVEAREDVYKRQHLPRHSRGRGRAGGAPHAAEREGGVPAAGKAAADPAGAAVPDSVDGAVPVSYTHLVEDVAAAESVMDVEGLVNEALEGIERIWIDIEG